MTEIVYVLTLNKQALGAFSSYDKAEKYSEHISNSLKTKDRQERFPWGFAFRIHRFTIDARLDEVNTCC